MVRKVLRVNQIPNQIPHIKIHKSTQRIQSVTENPVIRTIILTVRLITQITSSLLHSSQIFAFSRYPNIFAWISLESINVSTITMTANTILSKTSVLKSPKIILATHFVCSISFPPTQLGSAVIAYVASGKSARKRVIITRNISFQDKKYYKNSTLFFHLKQQMT